MSRQLILYSTWGCHLCEQAEQLLQQVVPDIAYEVIDIVDDAAAFARYRVAIPVLRVGDKELGWPFNAAQLATWLKDIK
ncbi:glutaredoxin family protein [Rheinheimera nanhaiensis]|uniref:Thiol-disulfide isomerase and thioredoxin n=1 Tax=Rheinheimera nanhaiensis E407-8 TaxID=562729 RepID=I1DYK9_9GAMM|nr:glutaredoxin family protein [Rheinheimera nanhaiensis]GAB59137.1 thiol-disulfide isomerase and thioredoxin [Rheinheimera nanhaiensis E407-8]